VEGLVCREATPEDVDDVLKVRNAIFPPLTPEQWRADPTMTCSMAYLEGEPVGAIPLSQRRFRLAPGVVVPVAFENAVGTREDMRSRGIGTAVIKAAREFLAGRCDELMVYRGAERSTGYRFYVKSGHQDLVYLRLMTQGAPQRREADVAVEGMPEIEACQEELLACFNATYGRYGGFPERHAHYWEQQLRSQIYTVLPQETYLVRHPAAGPLEAYVLAAFRTTRGREESLAVLEVAGKSRAGIEQALLGLEDLAAEKGLSVRVHGSADHPCLPLFRKLGYQEQGRSTMIMAQPLAPAELFRKVCRSAGLLADLKIDFWAPFGDGTLFEGPAAETEITLEGKDEVIYRLLNRRLDIRAAARTEWLTIRNGTDDIVERLAEALPYTPWVYHHLDYI
jgi:GNAT superfamily N-acetyltransferase